MKEWIEGLSFSEQSYREDLPSLPPPAAEGWPRRIFYRTRQFVRGLVAHVSAEEMLIAAEHLPKAGLELFCQMPVDAQRHSLNCLYSIRRQGCQDRDLAAAALLHDVGKLDAGTSLNPWLRTPLVLMDLLSPALTARWANNEETAAGWRRLLYVHRHHPAIGAAMAAEAHCSSLTCWLINEHQHRIRRTPTHRRDYLLALLQWADAQN